MTVNRISQEPREDIPAFDHARAEAAVRELDPADEEAPRTVDVPVCYAPEFAPDIDEVAKKKLDASLQ